MPSAEFVLGKLSIALVLMEINCVVFRLVLVLHLRNTSLVLFLMLWKDYKIIILYFKLIVNIIFINFVRQGSDEFVKHFLKVTDEVEICYLERKGKSTSELIVLVHGFSGRKEVLTGFFSLLPAYFQVIVVDVPGHGESKPCDEKADYTIDTQVEYLHKVGVMK